MHAHISFRTVFALLIVVIFIAWRPAIAAGDEADWSAGVASIKITPEKPVPLAGYASRVKPFESVDQDIFAKALVLKDGQGNRAVLVTIDLCVMPADIGQFVRKRIAEKTHIDEASILLNVAHSHSAPNVSLDPKPEPNSPYYDGTVEYTKWLCDRLVDVAQLAADRLKPARLSWGTGIASFAINRREFTDKGIILGNNSRGLVDRSVPVLRVDGADGKPCAILFGYACHNTTMPTNRLAVSADYEGYAREYIQQQYPGAEAMYITGCGGDANPYLRSNFQLTKDYGQTLGREVCRVMETKLQPVRGPVKCASVTANLPLQTPDRVALETIAKEPKGVKKEAAEKMLATLDAGGKLPQMYPVPVGAWQFGQDLTLIAFPDEVVVEYVHDVERAIGPLRLWISAYNQEVTGYIPSERILAEGGYESRGIYFGAGWFAPGVEDALTTAARDAAQKAGRAVQPAPSAQADPALQWSAVSTAMTDAVNRKIVSGVVTVIATKDSVASLNPVGLADIAHQSPMKSDTIFAIASMTKLVTATAVMMLQDDGKLSVDDPIGKYVPELAHLKTADGVEHAVTLKQVLTHTSGMGELTADESANVHTLADLIPLYAKKPLQFEPGTRWLYCQSGINSAGRIIEIVSGQSFEDFLRGRLFEPLGMKDTTFYPTAEQLPRIAKMYKRKDGVLDESPNRRLANYDPAIHNLLPAPNAGLFSTAPDFTRFCQMILNQGQFNGRQFLKPQTVKQMTSNQIGPIPSTHVPGSGFGLGWCVVEEPQGQTAPLSPGSHGHGGAFGTWAWIDPNKGLIYIMMIQRADFGGKQDNMRDIFMQSVDTSLKGVR